MEEINHKKISEAEYLSTYSSSEFERPSVATDMVIFTVAESEKENYRKLPEKELQLLLIKRGKHPFLGQWALPGGFVRPTETTEQAAQRELCEETGVQEVYLEQLYTFSELGRDPRTWVMSCAYMALVDQSLVKLKAGDDADEAKWFKLIYKKIEETEETKEGGLTKYERYQLSLEAREEQNQRVDRKEKKEKIQLQAEIEKKVVINDNGRTSELFITKNSGIAFDHAKIIAYAVGRLRGKIEYTDIALHLMPRQFTLTALQQVYEVILDKPLLKAAFRRKIVDLVKETENYTDKVGHRPSRLYEKNWMD